MLIAARFASQREISSFVVWDFTTASTRGRHLLSIRWSVGAVLDKVRDQNVVRLLACQIDFVIDIAPAPSLGRVIALDDRMTDRFEVLAGVSVGRLVAATNMPTTAAKP